jgi:putative DNA primase/helicase
MSDRETTSVCFRIAFRTAYSGGRPDDGALRGPARGESVVISGGDFKPTHGAGVYDLDEVAARLRERAEEWIPEHFPHGRRDGGDWRLANIKGDPPRKNGSCVITLKGEHAGDWIDFDGNAGGGPIDTLARATGLSGRALYAYAAKLVGVSPGPRRRQSLRSRRARM